MTVYRAARPPHHWMYNFKEGGARYSKYCIDPDTGVRASNKTEARRIEEKIRVRVREAAGVETTGVQPGAFTLGEAMLLHLMNNAGSSVLHRENLKNYSSEIIGFLGGATPVTKITTTRVGEYKTFCAQQTVWVWKGGPRKRKADVPRKDKRYWKDTGKPRTPETCNHYLDCLRGALLAAHGTLDTVTGNSMLPFPPAVEAFPVIERLPTPIPEQELAARRAVARPWTRDAMDLARLFGLRQTEAVKVTIHHIRTETVAIEDRQEERRYLFFRGEEQKGKRDVRVHGGKEGSDLLVELDKQARSRGVEHLVTWPGLAAMKAWDRGKKDVEAEWTPLKRFRRSLKASANLAGIERPHRYHDVRARYGTFLAKHLSGRALQDAMRHQDFETTQKYIDAAELDVMDAVDEAMAKRPIIQVVTVPSGAEQKVKPLKNVRATESQTRSRKQKKNRPRRTG